MSQKREIFGSSKNFEMYLQTKSHTSTRLFYANHCWKLPQGYYTCWVMFQSCAAAFKNELLWKNVVYAQKYAAIRKSKWSIIVDRSRSSWRMIHRATPRVHRVLGGTKGSWITYQTKFFLRINITIPDIVSIPTLFDN